MPQIANFENLKWQTTAI